MNHRRRTLGSVAVLVALALAAPAYADPRKKKPSRRARIAVEHKQRKPAPDLNRKSSPATAPTLEDRLREELKAIWGGRILRRGVTSVYVVDARSGKELFSVHPDDKLNPASNVKLLSTATVLDALGPEWRYTTKLFGPAPGPDGVLPGSLYLRGSGDPTFARGALDGLARQVAARGVRAIEGDVVLSDELMRDALGSTSIDVVVDGSGRVGAAPSVTVRPATSFVEVAVTATISANRRASLRATSRIIDDPETGPRLRVEIGGAIRQGQRKTVSRPVERRSSYTAHALREALTAAGVTVAGRPRLASFEDYVAEAGQVGYLPVVLASHQSVPMRDLVAVVNKRSVNWLADRIVMTAGAELVGGAPSMTVGLKAMKDWVRRAGIDPSEMVVDTGSGLSYATKLSARQIVRILRVASGHSENAALGDASMLDGDVFRQSLAVGGIDGTLRGRFTRPGLKGQVLGKTGTLTGCIALSGLVSAGGDDSLCFAIVTNGNRPAAKNSVRSEHDQMVLAMRRYLEARAVERVARQAAAEARAAVGAALVVEAAEDAAAMEAAMRELPPSPAGQPARADALPASP
jgi:serine-type D-Ala-D-Ala carboxypeptidase/endopeptidase (penicillin-binding protein 4)